MKPLRRRRGRPVVMNGTLRPCGIWRIAGMGPFEWVLSHRPFLRWYGEVQFFRSIYTPKPRRKRRREIPGLDHEWRKFRDHPREDFPF